MFQAFWTQGPLEETSENPRETVDALRTFHAYASSSPSRILLLLIQSILTTKAVDAPWTFFVYHCILLFLLI